MGAVKPIKVGVNGACGRMGRVVSQGIKNREDMALVFQADKGDDLKDKIIGTEADVVVEFTTPDAVFENTLKIISAGARPVIGATGLEPHQVRKISDLLLDQGLGGVLAPNFSMGALLMMKLAKEVSRHMKKAEIIELHHDKKADSPSGTALKTAEMLAQTLGDSMDSKTSEPSISRGELLGGLRIHSVRLPGIMARQEVIFGCEGETLSITHNVTSRECFLPGVIAAIHDSLKIKGLQEGLNI